MNKNINVEEMMKDYEERGFNKKQLEILKAGLEKGLNVFVYAKPEYNWNQMYEIMKGLEQKLDVSSYARPELHFLAMNKIRVEMFWNNI